MAHCVKNAKKRIRWRNNRRSGGLGALCVGKGLVGRKTVSAPRWTASGIPEFEAVAVTPVAEYPRMKRSYRDALKSSVRVGLIVVPACPDEDGACPDEDAACPVLFPGT